MDLFTLSAINFVIGLFATVYFFTEFRRIRSQKYLLDLCFAGVCLVAHSAFSMLHLNHTLPGFISPFVINTVTVALHLMVLSALHRLLELPLQRFYLATVVIIFYVLQLTPIIQQDQLSRLLLAFGIIILINVFCLRVLARANNETLSSVVTFFKWVMFFNIAQMTIRGMLFISGKYGFTTPAPNPIVYQLGWFSLTIYGALILTGGLMILARQRQRELEHRAERDSLTGLLDRSSMQNKLNAELNRCHRQGQPLTLMIFDIDFFKRVNDKYGHQVGDKVIQAVADIAQKNLRNYDLLFRIGGEEFLICLPGTNATQATHKAEELRLRIEALDLLPEEKITISIGFAIAEEKQELDTLIKQADDALYHAKGAGRNKSVAWQEGMLTVAMQTPNGSITV
ncbi:GGDEF domain-containing protein [Arsukibacterium perlucidum]|uniref:GGDEF domain-containing protein n=1 Tax=Arsukibacterium perlucidum TaxID=368811 RepID=UPI00037A1F59|nr:GGDEF domain-containing protein [Arsukibacterium perlucidum]